MSSRFSHCKLRPAARGGFGLIELMISITIITIVTAVIMARQSSFNSAVLLRNQAYEVALTMREVQLNAVSAVGFNSNFRTVLGVHFDTANDSTYRIFSDNDSTIHYYEANEEFGLQHTLDRRFEVRGIRTYNNGVSTDRNSLSIVFERPNFDARFFVSGGEVNASRVEIDISQRDMTGNTPDQVRTIEITSTGQIAVQ